MTEYFYFGSEVISEKQGSAWTDYIFFGGQRVALNTGASLATAKFLHTDHLGSTRVCTDASGNATGQCAYEPFGEFTGGASACTIPTSYRFAGMQFDSETGLYRRHERGAELFADAGMRFRSQTGSHPTWFCGFSSRVDSTGARTPNRQYDPTQGRWLSVDPLPGDSTDPQSLNRYVYVRNDPVNLVDPLGLQEEIFTFVDLGDDDVCRLDGLDVPCSLLRSYDPPPGSGWIGFEVLDANERRIGVCAINILAGRVQCWPPLFPVAPGPSGSPSGGSPQQTPPVHPQTPCNIGGGRRYNPPSHPAIDVQTPAGYGTPLYAPESGRIVAAYGSGWRVPPPYNLSQRAPAGATNYFIFRTDSGYTVTYSHAHAVLPQPNQIPRGALVGFTDQTGRQTAPHVHISVRNPQGQLIDPTTYFTGCQ